MNTLTRKQREIKEREELILEVARRMLLEVGYLGMTMDRIAEVTEYSKGTIYQHFSCKEDIVAAFCIQTEGILLDMFERAAAFKGRSRERMVAIGQAYELFTRLHPDRFRTGQIIMAASIKAKASPEHLSRLQAIDSQIYAIMTGIVRDAVSQGDLELPEACNPGELTFGCWSLAFGAYSLILAGVPLDRLGIEDPFATVRKNCQAFLDGLAWRPLSSEWDYEKTYERIRKEVFPDEFRRAHAG
ncbi:MAG: TetR/AcrR family transcriptional regulator [Nitrospinota bacterium]